MRRHQLTEGREVRLRGNDYMHCKVRRVLPNNRGPVMVECECSSNGDFRFGMVKTFRMVDLVPSPFAAEELPTKEK